MKVYMVTSGEYSDYGVCGIFSTKEKAEQYISFMLRGQKYSEFNDVELLEVDSYDEHIREDLNMYCGRMYENGDIVGDIKLDNYYILFGNRFAVSKSVDDVVYMVFYIKSDSEERAIKIANDRRAQIISNNMFVDGYREGWKD